MGVYSKSGRSPELAGPTGPFSQTELVQGRCSVHFAETVSLFDRSVSNIRPI